jgi:hypothetical protein
MVNATEKKIGSYSTVEIKNWMSTPINNTKQKRTKKAKDVVHQIFSDFCNMTNDNMWKGLFQKASIDKFPQGFSYSNNFLLFKKRNKIEKIEIENSTEENLAETINFFKKFGSICDDENENDVFNYLYSMVKEYTSWSQIRGKKKKDYFLSGYVDFLIKKYNLNEEESRHLHDQIHFGYCLKIIDSNNIKIENMEIVNIDNLIFDENTRKFELLGEPKYKKTSRKRNANEAIPKNSSLYLWLKYVSKITGNTESITNDTNIEETTDVENLSTTI